MSSSGVTPTALPAEASTTYEMLGVQFNLLDTAALLDTVSHAVETGQRWVVGGHNVHSIYLFHHDEKMRRFYQHSRCTFLDGMPLVWLARWLGLPARATHRHAPFDWMPLLLQRATDRGWRVFFLGSTPEIAERGAERLRDRFPGLELETHHGFFDMSPGGTEAEAVLQRIQEFRPHLLCVCMGMPRQEHWIVDNLDRLEANAVFDLGALLDLFSGALHAPPRWVGRIGLEWLFRLVSQPRRVWRRYLVEPWFLLPHLARDLFSPPRRSVPRPRATGSTE